MGKFLNIGNAGFVSVRKGHYVDKTGMISYINSNLNKPLSLQSIAMAVYLHPTYLSNIFKKQTGISPAEYKRRIDYV